MNFVQGTSPIRILIVDDHPVLREGVTSILEDRTDMIVIGEARDGAEAVARYRELRPDVTLMDLQMPVMNGVDAITAIRGDFPDARILVLTTYAGDVQAARAHRLDLRSVRFRRKPADTLAGHFGEMREEIGEYVFVHGGILDRSVRKYQRCRILPGLGILRLVGEQIAILVAVALVKVTAVTTGL